MVFYGELQFAIVGLNGSEPLTLHSRVVVKYLQKQRGRWISTKYIFIYNNENIYKVRYFEGPNSRVREAFFYDHFQSPTNNSVLRVPGIYREVTMCKRGIVSLIFIDTHGLALIIHYVLSTRNNWADNIPNLGHPFKVYLFPSPSWTTKTKDSDFITFFLFSGTSIHCTMKYIWHLNQLSQRYPRTYFKVIFARRCFIYLFICQRSFHWSSCFWPTDRRTFTREWALGN